MDLTVLRTMDMHRASENCSPEESDSTQLASLLQKLYCNAKSLVQIHGTFHQWILKCFIKEATRVIPIL